MVLRWDGLIFRSIDRPAALVANGCLPVGQINRSSITSGSLATKSRSRHVTHHLTVVIIVVTVADIHHRL